MPLVAAALPVVVAAAVAAAGTAATPTPIESYRASLAFAKCMRAHGVPHPDSDRAGDFRLTAADERRMRSVGGAKREAAEQACFRYLKPVTSTKALSPQAKARAVKVLRELARCVRGYGFVLGKPVVENLTLGRAKFGFTGAPRLQGAAQQRLMRAEHTCEKRVRLAQRLDSIVAADRGPY